MLLPQSLSVCLGLADRTSAHADRTDHITPALMGYQLVSEFTYFKAEVSTMAFALCGEVCFFKI